MAVYSFKARPKSGGKRITGTLTAVNHRDAFQQLRDRGLIIQDLTQTSAEDNPPLQYESAKPSTPGLRLAMPKLGLDVTPFLRELATLLNVGIPMVRALQTLDEQYASSGSPLRPIVNEMKPKIVRGGHLNEAMADRPDLFGPVDISIVAAGEHNGTIVDSLRRLAAQRDRQRDLRRRVRKALTYPTIVLIVAVTITLLLMTFVVPTLLEPLLDQKRALPLPTLLVKFISDTLIHWWWLILIATAAGVFFILRFIKGPVGRRWLERMLLVIPVIGEIVKKSSLSRVSTVLASQISAGVMLLEALALSRETARNYVIEDAIERVETAVARGDTAAQAAARESIFPPMMKEAIATGEISGTLDDMLDRVAKQYAEDVEESADRLVTLLKPALILILGGVVLLIALAVILPLVELMGSF